MSQRLRRACVAVAALVVALGGTALTLPEARSAPSSVTSSSAAAGSPAAGQSLFLSLGCRGCHAVEPGATTPTTGPVLNAEALAARAREVGKQVGPFVAESIVAPPADPAPGWVSSVMRSYAELRPRQLDDLVSYLLGTPYAGSGPAGVPLPANPVGACTARTACRATVARWTRKSRLPAPAVPGAKIVAVSGCLSCHSYAGDGVGSASDLTRQGLRGRSSAWTIRWLKCASCVDASVRMPSFAALGAGNLNAVTTFLAASKGRRR